MASTSSTGTANCSAMVAEVAGNAYWAGLDSLVLLLSARYHSWTGILRVCVTCCFLDVTQWDTGVERCGDE